VPLFGQEQSSVLIFTNLRCQQWPKKEKNYQKKKGKKQQKRRIFGDDNNVAATCCEGAKLMDFVVAIRSHLPAP